MINDKEHYERVAEAFSYKAQVYDEFGKDHPNMERMRRKVYAHVLGFIRPGARMLEINAGTGTDAAFFASLGYSVHATDISPGMLAAIQAKIEQRQLENRLSVEYCSFTDLHAIEGRPFDYLFSNFGGLNCIDDLDLVAQQVPKVLAPSGYLTWVIMPPVCPWEIALALNRDFRTAFRRLRPGGIIANVEGVHFHVRYFTPRQVLHALGEEFQLQRQEGLSIFTPPADHKEFPRRHPKLYNLMAHLDDHTSGLPVLRGWGDFFILTSKYCP